MNYFIYYCFFIDIAFSNINYQKTMKLKIEKVEYDTQVFIGIHIPYQDTFSRDKIKTIEGSTRKVLARTI
jgi:hypothetical protein